MFKAWDEIVKGCLQGNTGNEVATLSCVPAVFSNFLNGSLMLIGTWTVLVLIFAGYKYMNSGGDPKKLEGARETLTYSILGIIVVLLSFLIINIISRVTGIECIRTFGFGCK
ncbi:MAG: hypothetical protein HY425_01110 [Candidatus Levybacteria bacterium]|nr:hypothetical protein [Candidatus Levybacteria bacterium]